MHQYRLFFCFFIFCSALFTLSSKSTAFTFTAAAVRVIDTLLPIWRVPNRLHLALYFHQPANTVAAAVAASTAPSLKPAAPPQQRREQRTTSAAPSEAPHTAASSASGPQGQSQRSARGRLASHAADLVHPSRMCRRHAGDRALRRVLR